jgi:UDP-N-acetylglucosamine 4-epimerase
MNRALVTGGCGFIGSSLARELICNGWKVDVVDDLSNGDISALEGLEIRVLTPELLEKYDESGIKEDKTLVITGDFSSPYILSRIADGNYDYVFHLAALPRVEFSVQNPALTTDQNVMRTVLLMTACCGNIKRFIFSSSSAIYGDVFGNFPSREDGNNEPSSPYALQKKVVEEYCALFYKLYELESVCLRYFNVFGPGQLGDSPYSTAVSAWMDKLSKDQPLRSDGDGEQSRDLIFITDVVRANVLAALSKRTMTGDVYNIGTGVRYTNNYILCLLRERFDNLEITYASERPGDVKHTQADATKAVEDLGFRTKVNFKDGLDATISWWNLDEKKSPV